MRIAIAVFPGSGAAADMQHAYRDILHQEVFTVWHQEEGIIDADVLVIPGGASYGDYLRPGALATTSPICAPIRRFAADRKPILGVGNGFQILCELGLLPGLLLPNRNSRYLNEDTFLLIDNEISPWTRHLDFDDVIELPIACDYGRYFADKRALKDLEEGGHIAFRFCDAEGEIDEKDPYNGSSHSIAGILNRHENILGLICHPERAVEKIMGNTDGIGVLESVLLGEKVVTQEVDDDFDDDDDDDDDDD